MVLTQHTILKSVQTYSYISRCQIDTIGETETKVVLMLTLRN